MKFSMRLNMFLRSFFLQTGWNFMKFQNLGLTFVMMPFLKQLYKDDQDALPSVLQRYLENFNTQPVMASFCFGALAKQEEAVARAESLTKFKEKVTEWASIKKSLSITTASIGDRLFWGTLKPLTLLLAISIWILLGVNFFETEPLQPVTAWSAFAAGAAAFLVYNTIALFVRWQGLQIGYESDESSCFGLTRFDWNRTIYNAKRIGICFAVVLILLGVHRYFTDVRVDIEFIARAVLVLFFIIISFVTRRLRIPNVYLYLTAVIIFNLVCFF